MYIYIYPNSRKSFEVLAGFCDDFTLPDPVCWDHASLECNIRELVTTSNGEQNKFEQVSWTNNVKKGRISEPVILFLGVPPGTITKVVNAYKSIGEWPIFAVITKASMNMTLSGLFEHLLEDRRKEMDVKARLGNKA